MANEQLVGQLQPMTAIGWESTPSGQQTAGVMAPIVGREQYAAGAGPYLDRQIRGMFSGDAYGGATAIQEIRSAFSGFSYCGAFLEPIPVELRPLLTGFAYGGGYLDLITPAILGDGGASDADDGVLDSQIPAVTFDGFGGATLTGQLPVPFPTASGTVPGIGRLDIEIGFLNEQTRPVPIFYHELSGGGGHVGELDIEFMRYFSSEGQFGWDMDLPSFFGFSVEGEGSVSAVGRLDHRIPYITGEASGTGGYTGVLDEMVPPIYVVQSASLVETVPPIRIVASGGEDVTPVLSSYAVNMKLKATTEYNHWPFAHVVRFRDQYIGVCSAGAYVIGAGDADGTPFNVAFTLPKIDFGVSSLKRLVHLHATQRNSGKVVLSTTPDEGDAILYEFDGPIDAGIRTRRQKLMKGPRARYWTVRIEGQDGEPFDLDDLEIRAQIIHGRRIR